MTQLVAVLSGALVVAAVVVSLFFLRFWRTTGDRFFLYFALAFALEAVDRIALSMTLSDDDARPAVYLVRLAAYLLILLAIGSKNRRHKPTTR